MASVNSCKTLDRVYGKELSLAGKERGKQGHTKTFHLSSERNQLIIKAHSVHIISKDLYSQWAKFSWTSISQGSQIIETLFLLCTDCILLPLSQWFTLPCLWNWIFYFAAREGGWWGIWGARKKGTGKKKKSVSWWLIHFSLFNTSLEGSGGKSTSSS